jgi:hypothetical protein
MSIKQLHGLIKWSADNIWVVWAVLTVTIVLWGLSIDLPKDASPLLRSIFTYTSRIGALAVVIMPSIRLLMNGGRPLVRHYFFGFAALTMVCSMLAEAGDAAIAWVKANPLGAIAVGVSLLLVRAVVDVARPSQQSVALDFAYGRLAGGGPGVARASQRLKPSANDNKTIAAHEAGHALLHAALAALPTDFVAVMEQNHDTGSLGFVTGVNDGEHMLTRRTFAEWRMLVLLAGMAAEKALLGSETLGGSSDYRMWVAMAHTYLSNGIKGLFYSEPLGTVQVMFNKISLDNLQREQEALLAEFFAINLDVLTEVADTLVAHRRLEVEALTPFMRRIRFPKGFPHPI